MKEPEIPNTPHTANPEKYRWLYFLPDIRPILLICGYVLHQPYLFWGLFLLSGFVFVILDFFVTRDETYSYDEILTTPENDGRLVSWLYQIQSFSYFLLSLIAFGYSLYFVQFEQPTLAWFLYVFPNAILTVSLLSYCHEYFHKNNWIEKAIARFFLSLLLYPHLEYDHLCNHHNDEITCTDKDPAYARLNQSLYHYAWIMYVYNFVGSFALEKEKSIKNNTHFFNIFKNATLRWTLISVLIYISIFVFIGPIAGVFFVLQTFFGYLLFAAVTYNQHYGLTRRRKEDGTLESFTFMNIWASNHFLTGKLFINSSHHGHHHFFSFCRYPYLKVFRLGPLLPYGYASMAALAFFPKLWAKVMNPLVEEVFKRRDQYEKDGIL